VRGACRQPAGVTEVLRYLVGEPRVGLREEPEDDEDRHNGGDEVGVGDLPRSAVIRRTRPTPLLHDDPRLIHRRAQALALFSPRQAWSVSSEVGRSSEKIALRANSIATIGADPRTEASSPSLMQRRYLAFATPCSSALVAIGWK